MKWLIEIMTDNGTKSTVISAKTMMGFQFQISGWFRSTGINLGDIKQIVARRQPEEKEGAD